MAMYIREGVKFYSPAEERINVWSHGVGAVMSLIGLVLLVLRAVSSGDVWRIISFSIFGVSLFLLYLASTIYHRSKTPAVRARLNVFDHASIFVLIAGSYTPFTLVTLYGWVGWTIFGITWGAALTGIVLRIFFIGRYKLLSVIMYLVMGWIIVFAIKPLIENMPAAGLGWLLAGGISYTVGAVLYSLKGIKFNHAIFHFLVLAGSVCHFVTVYWYV
ncbi:MAG: hemolysin III family protein [Bacteroidales bacterium]|nr:hemolysin III family protein [Bacteroidales bacterium]